MKIIARKISVADTIWPVSTCSGMLVSPRLAGALIVALLGCTPQNPPTDRVPSREYSSSLRAQYPELQREYGSSSNRGDGPVALRKPFITLAGQQPPQVQLTKAEGQVATDMPIDALPSQVGETKPGSTPEYYEESYRHIDNHRYAPPLEFGDPGTSSSLWHEGRNSNELFRDDRAWLPGDLITILVRERSEGSGQADTDSSTKSSLTASVSAFFGYEKALVDKNPNLNPESMVDAAAQSDFEGEGTTNRRGSLTARISGVVVEVLPTGVLRVEGEKIMTVNDEQEVMVISGLLRPRDVDSANEVDSGKLANMRIDYYGRGTVGSAQNMGWFQKVFRAIWPF